MSENGYGHIVLLVKLSLGGSVMNITLFLTLVTVAAIIAIVAAVRQRRRKPVANTRCGDEFEGRMDFFLTALRHLFDQAQASNIAWDMIYTKVAEATRQALTPKDCRKADYIDTQINYQLRLAINSLPAKSPLRPSLIEVRTQWREKYVRRTKEEPFRHSWTAV